MGAGTLDDILAYFGYARRGEYEKHEAVNDCQLAAKVYMKMMQMPPLKKATLGFIK